MRAAASLVADRPPGARRTRCTTLRSSPPLTLRATGDDLVHLVGSAAGPVGGDDLRLAVDVGPGASLTVRSVAASVVLPGPAELPSTFAVDASVGAGATLRWLPEPTIAVRGCDHRATTHLRVADGATVVWREVVVLGRHDEAPGSVLQRLRVDLGGRPLLRNDLGVGPRWPGSLGPAGVGDARAVATALIVGPGAAGLHLRPAVAAAPDAAGLPVEPAAAAAAGVVTGEPAAGPRAAAATRDGVRGAVLPLAGPAALVTILGRDAGAALAALDDCLGQLPGTTSPLS